MNPYLALALLLLIATVLLALPLVPAFVEFLWPTDSEPLRIIQEHAGEIRHFARSFRQSIHGMEWQLLQCAVTRTVAGGVMPDGSQYLLLGASDLLPLSPEEREKTLRKVIVAAMDLGLPGHTAFAKELYCRGKLSGGEQNTYRSVLGEKGIELGAGSKVLRWVHSRGELNAGPDCALYGRASSDQRIRLEQGCVFERLNAPEIEFGSRNAGELPNVGMEAPGLPASQTTWETPRSRKVIDGDFAVGPGAVIAEHIVVHGDLRIGAGAFIRGSVKSTQTVTLGAKVTIEGSVIAGRVRIGSGCRVHGPILAEREILIGAGTHCGSLHQPTTVAAPRIQAASGVVVFGTVWAREQGKVVGVEVGQPHPPRLKARIAAATAGAVLSTLLLFGCSAAEPQLHAGGDDQLFVLVPDGTSLQDPRVTVWVDGGREEGLHVVGLHDSELVRPLLAPTHYAGLILPDSIHQRASDLLLDKLRQYVRGGGKLMLVYDAGTLSLAGRYAPRHSRLSDLAGVDYALYDELHDKTSQWSEVRGDVKTMTALQVPPGKYYPFASAGQNEITDTADVAKLRRYQYGDLRYPSFITSGDYSGTVLLRSDAGVAAGEHSEGRGSVLFVNLPLGYLKQNTDGLLLHAFLKHFARGLSLPSLATVPDGIGGLVLNWHIDSNAALEPLREMSTWSILQQGPYSVHVTAGPDAYLPEDGKGLNLLSNVPVQQMLLHFAEMGYAIGSHGGWIHNYFADHVDVDDPARMKVFISLNKDALETVLHRPVVEYSAPEGNQPQWATRWLEEHGFVAYYFTGNTGMGPTRGYRDGQRAGWNIWAFPIMHLDRAAAFEEMQKYGYGLPQIAQWLDSNTDFVVRNHVARLVYFHPPGIVSYERTVEDWLGMTARLRQQGTFRWYTMTQLATFLNQREHVSWTFAVNDGLATLVAIHPQDLAHQAWMFPQSRFAEPQVVAGAATVTQDEGKWFVVAGNGRELKIQARIIV